MTVSKAPAAGPSGLTTTGALPRHRCMLGRCTPATVTAHAPHCQEWNVFRHDTQPYFSAPRDKSLNDALYGQYGRPMIVASRQPLAPVCLTVGIARQLGWPCCSCCQAAHQHWGLKLACAEQAVSRHRVQGTRGCGGLPGAAEIARYWRCISSRSVRGLWGHCAASVQRRAGGRQGGVQLHQPFQQQVCSAPDTHTVYRLAAMANLRGRKSICWVTQPSASSESEAECIPVHPSPNQ